MLIKINKKAATKLNSEFNVPFGENGISKTKNKKHPTYFLCESERNLRLLLKVDQNDEAQMILDKIDRTKKRRNPRKKK